MSSTGDMNPVTCEEALERWDADELIWSVAMSEIGPSHEQMVQIMGIECVRFLIHGGEPDKAKDICMAVAEDNGFKPTGPQLALAMNFAFQMKHHGWQAAVLRAPQERRILVKRSFP